MDKPTPAGRNDDHIFDYSKITDNIYIGSDLCKGSICPVHSQDFKRLGICVEINLSDERKEIPPDDIDSFTWMPVVDGYPPNPIQMDIGTQIINTTVEQGKTVYVHCKNGHGRSPTLVAAYFIRYKGYTVDKAIALVKERREESHIEENQKKALEEFAKEWSK